MDESREGEGGDGFVEDAADVKARLKVGLPVNMCMWTFVRATFEVPSPICPTFFGTACFCSST